MLTRGVGNNGVGVGLKEGTPPQGYFLFGVNHLGFVLGVKPQCSPVGKRTFWVQKFLHHPFFLRWSPGSGIFLGWAL